MTASKKVNLAKEYPIIKSLSASFVLFIKFIACVKKQIKLHKHRNRVTTYSKKKKQDSLRKENKNITENVSHETFLFRSYPQAKNSIKIHIIFYAPLIPYFKRNYFSIFLILFFSKEINKLSTTCVHIPLNSHNFKKSNIPTVLYKNELQFLSKKI